MRDNKLHTPYGVKDYLPCEYYLKRKIENKIENVFYTHGFTAVESPMFEYMEVFEGRGSIKPKQMYKFIDRDGEILSLRSDITPPIGRIAATNYSNNDIPLRFCYTGNVFRYNESYQGKLREFTQSGVELIGINSNEADAEVITLAIKSLLACGFEKFMIDIGQVQFLRGVLEETGFDNNICNEIQNYIVKKNFVEVSNIVNEKETTTGIKKLFTDLPTFIGTEELLDEVISFTKNDKAIKSISDLKQIYNILKCYGLQEYVRFDLSMIGHLDYYTGIIFSGYTYGTGFSLLNGGRYDNLISGFGENFPSVGFSIKLNEVMAAIESQKIEVEVEKTDTLLVYTSISMDNALKTAEQLRKDGVYIENSLLGDDIEKNIEYAKIKNLGGILFFGNDDLIEIIDIKENTRTKVTLEYLLNRA